MMRIWPNRGRARAERAARMRRDDALGHLPSPTDAPVYVPTWTPEPIDSAAYTPAVADMPWPCNCPDGRSCHLCR